MTAAGRARDAAPAGAEADVEALNAIIAQPGVREWWGTDPTVDDQDAFTIVVDGEIAGWLGWYEETDPDYRHGGLDIFLAPAFQGRGLGREALRLGAALADRGARPPPHRSSTRRRPTRGRSRPTRRSASSPSGSCAATSAGSEGAWHDGLLMDMLADEFSPS